MGTQSIYLQLLGPTRLRIASEVVHAGPPRQRAVLAFLALNTGRFISRDELVDAVWGDAAPTSAASNLQTYLSQLRRTLEHVQGDLPLTGEVPLRLTSDTGYRLHLATDELDVTAFDAALEEAELHWASGMTELALASWRRALVLWQGTPFGDVYAPFVLAQRKRLEHRRLEAVKRFAGEAIAADDNAHLDSVSPVLAELAGQYPLDEQVVALTMRVWHGQGRDSEALSLFHHTKQKLAEAVGLDPGSWLLSARDAIWPDAAGEMGSVSTAWHTGRGAQPPSTSLPARSSDLVGRESELAQLVAWHDGNAEDAVLIAALEGRPGSGKSAVALEFAHRAGRRFPDGCHYVDLRKPLVDGGASTTSDVLELLINALGVTSAPAVGGLEERIGTYRNALSGKRILLVLDNAQSADQVRPLLPNAGGSVVVVTSSNRLVGLSVRDGALRLPIAPLTPGHALVALAHEIGVERVSHDDSAILEAVHRCEGLPLALQGLAELLVTTPNLAETRSAGDPHRWATRLNASYCWSVGALDHDTKKLFLSLGRVPEDVVSVEGVSSLTGWSEAKVRLSLEKLVTANLIDWIKRDHYRLGGLVKTWMANCATDPRHHFGY